MHITMPSAIHMRSFTRCLRERERVSEKVRVRERMREREREAMGMMRKKEGEADLRLNTLLLCDDQELSLDAYKQSKVIHPPDVCLYDASPVCNGAAAVILSTSPPQYPGNKV